MQPWGVLNTDLSFFWQRERYFHLSLKDNEAIWNRLQFGTEVSLESLCLVILLHLLQFVKIFPSEQLKVYQASSRQSDSCIRVWCEIGEVRSIKYSLYVNFNSNASINVGDVRVKPRTGCNFTFVTLKCCNDVFSVWTTQLQPLAYLLHHLLHLLIWQSGHEYEMWTWRLNKLGMRLKNILTKWTFYLRSVF